MAAPKTGDFKFQIAENGIDYLRDVYPLEFNRAKFSYKADLRDGQIFKRVKYTGKLIFITDDYDYFNAFEIDNTDRCLELYIRIQMYCDGEWQTYWTGTFSTGMGYFDKDNCRFEVTPEVYDRYSCILKNWERLINILDVTSQSTGTIVLKDFELHICRDDTVTPATMNLLVGACLASRPTPVDTWKQLFQDHNGMDGIVIYFRERVVTNCQGGTPVQPDGTGWVLLSDDCLLNDTATWVRYPPGVYPSPLNNPDIQAGYCSGSGGTTEELPPTPVTKIVDVVTLAPSPVNYNDVRGFDEVAVNAVCKYKITAPTSSTLQWLLTANFATAGGISSGATTDTLDVTFGPNTPVGTVTITCVETTICGVEIHHIIEVTVKPFSGCTASTFSNTVILGPKSLCPNQTMIRYWIPEEYQSSCLQNTSWFIKLSPTGDPNQVLNGNNTDYLTVVSSTDNELILDATGLQTALGAPLHAHLQVWAQRQKSCCQSAPTVTNRLTGIMIRKAFQTDPIEGLSPVCPSSTGVVYSTYPRTGSTYLWTVDGGTIVSGQGTNEITVDWGSVEGDYEIWLKETADCGCLWILLSPCTDAGAPPYYWCDAGAFVGFDTVRPVYDVIVHMLDTICPSYNLLRSDFFEWNPKANAPGYVAGLNYITGAINQVDHLTIMHKSDAINPTASQPATIGEMSLKDMFKILREMFRVWWYIDDNGDIILEHYHFFKFAVGLNLTGAQYLPFTLKMNKYTHISEELKRYERYKWAEAKNRDFIGAEIRYDGPCVNMTGKDDVEEHNLDNISTDIQFIAESPEDIDPDGFVILANINAGGNYEIITDIGALSGVIMANAPLSWANLHRDYFHWDRLFINGYLNSSLTTFLGIIPNIKQVAITIRPCCDILIFDPQAQIRTELGQTHLGGIDGELESAEFEPLGQTLKLNIVYPY